MLASFKSFKYKNEIFLQLTLYAKKYNINSIIMSFDNNYQSIWHLLGGIIMRGFILSILAGAATGLGAVPLLILKRKISDKTIDLSLGFAAGVMLSATTFSLILPALDQGGIKALVIGMMTGVFFVDFMDKKIPHDHFVKGHEGSKGLKNRNRNIILFVLAIIIHNFPEGLAVGIGGFSEDSISLTLAIGIQNMLEGLAVAAALMSVGYDANYSAWIALLSGLVEPLGALVGISLISFSKRILPYALAFAGGAMLFVISDEVIPETHAGNNQRLATYAIIIGFIIMTSLDYII